MIIGTTPTFTLTIPDKEGLNLSSAEEIYFTIRQGSIKITKTGEEVTIINEHTV